jgi:hypothetical protein
MSTIAENVKQKVEQSDRKVRTGADQLRELGGGDDAETAA